MPHIHSSSNCPSLTARFYAALSPALSPEDYPAPNSHEKNPKPIRIEVDEPLKTVIDRISAEYALERCMLKMDKTSRQASLRDPEGRFIELVYVPVSRP